MGDEGCRERRRVGGWRRCLPLRFVLSRAEPEPPPAEGGGVRGQHSRAAPDPAGEQLFARVSGGRCCFCPRPELGSISLPGSGWLLGGAQAQLQPRGGLS